MNELAEKIRRVLAAACLGDALGAATEGMHPDEIEAVFGGRVETLREPPPRAPFAKGLVPGRLTDDATQMLAMARRIVSAGGDIAPEDAVAGLLDWAEDAETFARFAGPTTRLAVEQLRAGRPPAEVANPADYTCVFGTSNGAAMRAPAAGCARPGDVAAASRLACRLAAPTHNTQIAFGGAGALAGAIAGGLAGAPLAELLRLGDEGAAIGEAEALRHGRVTGGAGVRRRMALAAGIGRDCRGDVHRAARELTETVGNGVAMSEAVPHAFGLVVAAEGDAFAALLGAVNGGNDSDTIAMFAGSLAAAFGEGAASLPPGLVAAVEAANPGLDLAGLARDLARVATPSAGAA